MPRRGEDKSRAGRIDVGIEVGALGRGRVLLNIGRGAAFKRNPLGEIALPEEMQIALHRKIRPRRLLGRRRQRRFRRRVGLLGTRLPGRDRLLLHTSRADNHQQNRRRVAHSCESKGHEHQTPSEFATVFRTHARQSPPPAFHQTDYRLTMLR